MNIVIFYIIFTIIMMFCVIVRHHYNKKATKQLVAKLEVIEKDYLYKIAKGY